MTIDPELTVQIDTDDPTPMLGYPFAKQLLARHKPFTALFAYNDISAIGAIRALQEQGLRVPQDVSVMGFDDLWVCSSLSPSLSTVRQDTEAAARALIDGLSCLIENEPVHVTRMPTQLVIRESCGGLNLKRH